MSNVSRMREIILSVLADGGEHAVEEFTQIAEKQKLDLGKQNQTFRNALYSLKKCGYQIKRTKNGKYVMVDVYDINNKNNNQSGSEADSELDRAIGIIYKEIKIIDSINWKKDNIEKIAEHKDRLTKLRELKKRISEIE